MRAFRCPCLPRIRWKQRYIELHEGGRLLTWKKQDSENIRGDFLVQGAEALNAQEELELRTRWAFAVTCTTRRIIFHAADEAERRLWIQKIQKSVPSPFEIVLRRKWKDVAKDSIDNTVSEKDCMSIVLGLQLGFEGAFKEALSRSSKKSDHLFEEEEVNKTSTQSDIPGDLVCHELNFDEFFNLIMQVGVSDAVRNEFERCSGMPGHTLVTLEQIVAYFRIHQRQPSIELAEVQVLALEARITLSGPSSASRKVSPMTSKSSVRTPKSSLYKLKADSRRIIELVTGATQSFHSTLSNGSPRLQGLGRRRNARPPPEKQTCDVMHFAEILKSKANGVISEVDLSVGLAYEDMTAPLCDYYCNSSHNTYLTGDQLTSEASEEVYRIVLMTGCRCLELDCWDGDNGDPMVTHGHTLTSKISFLSCLNVIKDFAFSTSEYPVILSLETHCSVPQQTQMAKHLEDVFGKLLYFDETYQDAERLPSPADLKGRILVKGKRKRTKSTDSFSFDGPTSPTSNSFATEESSIPVASARSIAYSRAGCETNLDHDYEKSLAAKVAPELSHITFLAGFSGKQMKVPWQRGECFKEGDAPSNMSSFSEDASDKLVSRHPDQWIKYNTRQLSRIYPIGTRVKSTNYNPVCAWAVGAQMAALNFQTNDLGFRINTAKFLANGGCGYIHKPERLTSAGGPPAVKASLCVEVLCANNLPEPKCNTRDYIGVNKTMRGAVDLAVTAVKQNVGLGACNPYVVVELHAPLKVGGGGYRPTAQRFLSSTIHGNGYNPSWELQEPWEMRVDEEDLSFLYLEVWSSSTFQGLPADFLGYAVAPCHLVREGVRHWPLLDAKGSQALCKYGSPAGVTLRIMRRTSAHIRPTFLFDDETQAGQTREVSVGPRESEPSPANSPMWTPPQRSLDALSSTSSEFLEL